MHARRQILKTAGIWPLAVVLSNPVLAAAEAATLQSETLVLSSGKKVVAAVAYPAKLPAPTVILVHEWWGLNDQIKSVAAEYARLGFVAIAVDLYSGNVATSPEDARSYMKSVNATEAVETFQKWNSWARNNPKTTEKLSTVGWCFGGGWSLNASLHSSVDATVIYYGNVARKAEELKTLSGPVMGHFATRDQWINKGMVDGFVREMAAAGKPAPQIFWYEADHAFANPSGARYDQVDAQLSWQRTLDFLKQNST
jgi:carboxymethylenebutenolidase